MPLTFSTVLREKSRLCEFAGTLIGFALKKVLKILAILFGLFPAGLAYLQYLQIININWNKLQGTSQNAVTSLADATTQISNHISNVAESNYHATPALAISDFGIPLTGSMATGFAKSSISISVSNVQFTPNSW